MVSANTVIDTDHTTERNYTSAENARRLERLKRKLRDRLERTPLIKKLPPRVIAIILLLVLVNLIVWTAAGIVLAYHPALTGTAVLAYTFGLRHALDADHISAIDLMTRRLVASGQRPVSVGTWFSLGHSTIVIITSIIVAASAAAISSKFDTFSHVGGIIGSSISAAFLLLLGIANAYIVFLILRQLRKLLRAQREEGDAAVAQFRLEGAGFFFRIFKRLFKLIDRPWKMYPLGVLFGLGFDTSSEVALLGISSIQATHGTSLWLILIFPALFTAGMCLLDTIDGALMLALYSSATSARDAIAIAYYNVVLTAITVVVAVVIGILQVLGLAVAVVGEQDLSHSRFWRGVIAVGARYDIVGGAICGLFVVSGIASVLLYKPWRRWVDQGQVTNVGMAVAPACDEAEIIASTTSGTLPETIYPSAAGVNDIEIGKPQLVFESSNGTTIVQQGPTEKKGFSVRVELTVSVEDDQQPSASRRI